MFLRCLLIAGTPTPKSSANAFWVSQTVSALKKTSPFTAPSGAVQAESLAPPPGSAQASRVQQAAAAPAVQAGARLSGADAVPLRLPEAVTQVQARPGQLAVECGGFSQPDYANAQRERLARLGAYITTDYYAPRDRAFIVRLGPFRDVASAEAAMRRALPLVPDARIVVE